MLEVTKMRSDSLKRIIQKQKVNPIKKTFEKQITPFIFTDTEAYLSSQLDNKSLWECFSLIWSAWSSKPVIQVKGYTWVLNFGIWIFRCQLRDLQGQKIEILFIALLISSQTLSQRKNFGMIYQILSESRDQIPHQSQTLI